MRIKRQTFLQQLESVQPGLAAKDVIPQAACFVFHNGGITTFNDHVGCRLKSEVGEEITGAVIAKPLLALLQKLPDNEVEISVEDHKEKDSDDVIGQNFLVRGSSNREARLRMETKILLPVKDIEAPEKDAWFKLPETFTEAVDVVSSCTSKDDTNFMITCIHLHPDYLEACDNIQAVRYPIKTGIAEEMLIPKENIQHVLGMDMVKVAVTPNFIHFRNPAGLRMSLRRYKETYLELTPVLVLEDGSKKWTLPGALADTIACAEIFSQENPENQELKVSLKEDRMLIVGVGSSGTYRETKKVSYSGKPKSFMIAPKMLAELAKQHQEVMLGPTKIHVSTGRFVYISSIED